ncbi:SQE1 [Symbiodinium sp. KB8]|nr:SQE1 [Symbiodinium sp. KB8]
MSSQLIAVALAAAAALYTAQVARSGFQASNDALSAAWHTVSTVQVLALWCASWVVFLFARGRAAYKVPASPLFGADPTIGEDSNEYDADVIIVGAGCAGAPLAATWGKNGRKVLVIEKSFEQPDRIVGELLQPGGLRSLERMKLDTAAKQSIDSVNVYGYVVIPSQQPSLGLPSHLASKLPKEEEKKQANTPPVLLKYPKVDPETPLQFMGTFNKAIEQPQGAALRSEHNIAGTNSHPSSSGMDPKPIGRSFHNSRLVHRLQQAAAVSPNVMLCKGTVRYLLRASHAAAAKPSAGVRATFGAACSELDDEGDGSGGVFAAKTVGAPVDEAEFRANKGDGDVKGVVFKDAEGNFKVAKAPLVIVADGIASCPRTQLTSARPQRASFFVGLVLKHPEHKPPLPFPNHGHVILTNPSPVLLYQISSTETRILVDVLGELPSSMDGSLQKHLLEVVAPQLPSSVQPFFREAVAQDPAPKVMPNRGLVAQLPPMKGAILLGDAWYVYCCTASLCPTQPNLFLFSLLDVETLVKCFRGVDFRDVHARENALSDFRRARQLHAQTVNVLANALHRVFSVPDTDDGTRFELQKACYKYLDLGGMYSAGPVGLLAGLTPQPYVLVIHFFMVALYAMKQVLLPCPTMKRMRLGWNIMRVACAIIMPLLEAVSTTRFLHLCPFFAKVPTLPSQCVNVSFLCLQDRVFLLSSSLVQFLSNVVFPWKQLRVL